MYQKDLILLKVDLSPFDNYVSIFISVFDIHYSFKFYVKNDILEFKEFYKAH